MEGIAFAATQTLAAEIQARRIGCAELLDFYLRRAERINGEINAMVAWRIEEARERARQADSALANGDSWGPLHGVPVTVKESCDISGLPTTFGDPRFANNIARSDAAAVERLLDAGAVIFGKTNVPFMLSDQQSYNDIYGTTNNPWDHSRTPGGSSGGGAAAVAAGMAALELGSDVAGSIRIPAHYCGVYGHKSSFGLIPLAGHAPPGRLTGTDMAVLGPLARDAGDLALALRVLAGPDRFGESAWRVELPQCPRASLKDFRVAVWRESPFCEVDGAVLQRFDAAVDAIRRSGASLDDGARPELDIGESYRAYLSLLYAATVGRSTSAGEFPSRRAIAESCRPDDVGYRATVARGATMHHFEWLAANEVRAKARHAWRKFFERIDVLVTPIAPTTAFAHDHNPVREQRTLQVNGKAAAYADHMFWASLPTLSFLPATAAPIGLARDKLPVGMQIIGPECGDLTTIEFARLLAFEIGGFTAPPQYAA
jgi:amidase